MPEDKDQCNVQEYLKKKKKNWYSNIKNEKKKKINEISCAIKKIAFLDRNWTVATWFGINSFCSNYNPRPKFLIVQNNKNSLFAILSSLKVPDCSCETFSFFFF